MASFAPIRGTRAQIQATPIVDGQFLVETDQGIDNKIYMDEGSTRTIVGGNTVKGVLPELYIYSETGSVVTVEDAGGTSIPTSQIGTDHWICEVPDYGIYNIYSLLDGETTTQSINVNDCMIYTIDDSHFHCNIVVTYPSGVGASCQISGGGETYSAPALNPPDTSYKFVVHGKNTTYTITTNVDGAIKTQTVTTGTTLDQTYEVTMPYARVNLTVETPPITGNITCTDGTTTIIKPVASNMVFYLPNTGTWTISGKASGQTYSVEAVVTSLSTAVSVNLQTLPDGKTVTPTDDIQIWLNCAGIYDKTSYTTLNDVLADSTTLLALMSDNNAVDYLARSKTWTKNEGLVPVMTSETAPSGQVTKSAEYSAYAAWMAFNPSNQHGWLSNSSAPYIQLNAWVAYEFTTPKIVKKASAVLLVSSTPGNTVSGKIQAYDGSNWVDVSEVFTLTTVTGNPLTYVDVNTNGNTSYSKYRWICTTATSTSSTLGLQLQFYPETYDHGITEDETAMSYIGANNYCADTLLSDEDWCEAICNSTYFETVLNVKVPTMTSNTAPSGVVSASAEATPAYNAFNGVEAVSSRWGSAATTGWIQYEYTSSNSNKVHRVDIIPLCEESMSKAKHCILEGTNDGTTYDRIGAFDTAFTGNNSLQNQIFVLTHNYLTAYQTYRLSITNDSGKIYVIKLQFYGRKDV